MANYDHPDTIGTHPAYSWDPETRAVARLEVAERNAANAATALVDARRVAAEFGHTPKAETLKGRTVVITIGRNLWDAERSSQFPMIAYAWGEFRNALTYMIRGILAPEFQSLAVGESEWEGTREAFATFTASNVTHDVTPAYVRAMLAAYAAEFGQDSIALTIGDTELVSKS